MAFVVVFLCIFNVVMWLVFLKKFKSLFTTEDTVQNAKNQINKILEDLNRQTDRNINLLEDRYSRLRSLNAEADKKIKILNEMESKNLSLAAFQSNVKAATSARSSSVRAAERYAENLPKKVDLYSDYDTPVEITKAGESVVDQNIQTTLFDEAETEPKTRFEVVSTGPAPTEVPVVVPEIVMSDKPLVHKKELKDSITDLFDSGYDFESIANKLGCSGTEVQLALTLAGRI